MQYDYYVAAIIKNKNYVIKAEHVIEVLLIERLQRIPMSKKYIEGIIIRNGILIPIINIEDENSCRKDYNYYAIIFNRNDRYIGFLCEKLDMVKGDKVNIISDNFIIKKYNYKEEFIELLLEIDNKIYGLIEKEKLYRIIEENKIRRN